jgi:hypothetical protein
MQTGSDLVSAGYPVSNPLIALLGASNLSQPNVPPRSNLEWAAVLGTPSDTAIAGTGVGLAVAVPALPGLTITAAKILAGATAEATGSNGFVAVYSGIAVPALLGSTAAITGAAAIAASAAYTATLATPVTLSSTTCPNGFVYVSISFTATTMPTLISATPATATQTPWSTTAPLFYGATHGTALAGTAPATIASPATVAKVPLVTLI